MGPRLLLLLALALASGGQAKVYVTAGREIRRMLYDGAENEAIASVTGVADGIAVHPRLGLVYWADPDIDAIMSCRLDGSDVTAVISTGLDLPFGVGVDPETDQLIWADAGTDLVERSDLDGGNRETVASSSQGLTWPTHSSIVDGWAYYSDAGSSGGSTFIKRQLLNDSSSPETIVSGSDYTELTNNDIYGFQVVGEFVFFVANVYEIAETSYVQYTYVNKVPVGGGDVERIYRWPEGSYGVAVDEETGDLFFVEIDGAVVWRGDVNGSADPVAVWTDEDAVGDYRPWGVAVLPRSARCGALLCVAAKEM